MIRVRDVFVAKPGQASKLAKLLNDCFKDRFRVMTDVVGDFNTVVMESEAKDLAEFETKLAEYMGDEDLHAKMKGYTDMYQTGRREIYRFVE